MIAATKHQARNRRRHGAAAVEYALVLALLVGGVLLAAHRFSSVPGDTFGQLANATGRGPRATDSRSATSAASPDASDRSWRQSLDCVDNRLGIVLVAASGVGLCLSALVRLRRRRRAAPEAASEPEAPPPCQQLSVFEKRQRILRVLSKEKRLSADCIQIHHVMTPDVVSVRPNTTIPALRELMRTKRVRHLLVCDARGALLGVVSDRDLIARRGKTVADVMSHHPVTVRPDSLVAPSITWMINQHISCLPVVDGPRVVGVVTTTDLLLTLQCSLQLLEHLDDDANGAAATAAPLLADC